MAFIRTKRRDGRTYYSLVKCVWDGKPVQKVIAYLPASDSLEAPLSSSGTFDQQAQRFINEYTQAVGRVRAGIMMSKRLAAKSVSGPDATFHRARIAQLEAKAEQLKRCINILQREQKILRREQEALGKKAQKMRKGR